MMVRKDAINDHKLAAKGPNHALIGLKFAENFASL